MEGRRGSQLDHHLHRPPRTGTADTVHIVERCGPPESATHTPHIFFYTSCEVTRGVGSAAERDTGTSK